MKKALEAAAETTVKGNVGDTWDSCCDKACAFGRSIGGSEYPTNGQTIRCWNVEFRYHGMFLRNESRSRKTDIPLPRIFLDYSDEAINLRAFIRTNLEDISVEKVHHYIHDKLFLRIASSFMDREANEKMQKNANKEWNVDEDEVQMITINGMLAHYKLTSLSRSTVWSWMKVLGMKYDDRNKNYYVDGHKRPDVVFSRWIFVKKYLRRELRMHRWIQVSKEQLSELDIKLEGGYRYTNDTGEIMYEFHVDAHR